MAIDLTFGSNGGGGGAGSGDFVKDAFSDISLPATNNTSLTSTASTNPTSQLFGNDDAPKYSAKTLYIKGIKLLEDRSKWLSNKPTYEILWSENFPGVYGYVCGDARVLGFSKAVGKSIALGRTNDLFGITGNIRNALWLVNPSSSTSATAMRVTDGSNTTNIDFSGMATNSTGQGINKYAGFVHAATNATDDIHDLRLVAQQDAVLSVCGVVVFVENATADIKVFPGVSYVDKSKVTTSGITSMALPTGNTTTGFASVLYKTTASTYGITTQSVLPLVTGAAGAINTNIVTVTTGTGASYAAGMGIVVASGTSMHLSQVNSISTDVFTLGSTLPYNLSGATLWRAWTAGSTQSISATLFQLAFSLDPIESSNPINANSFGASASGNYMFQHPENKFRAWGELQVETSYNGYPILRPLGATTGFLQIDGDFQAAEVEWIGLGNSSVLHGTFSINGLPAWSQNQGFTAFLKQTIFTDASNGWNSLVFKTGASFLDVGIRQINLYQSRSPIGPTLGRLIELKTNQSPVARTAYNATLMALGLHSRKYADEIFFQGDWARSATTTAAGGVRFAGASTNSTLDFQFYGQNFAVIGSAGGSGIFTLDGASTAQDFNAIKSVATLGFHTLVYTYQAGATALIEAIDIFRPKSEITNYQNFNPLISMANISKTYLQSDTPRDAKDGDFWTEIPLTIYTQPRIWVKAFGYWLQLAVTSAADDPHYDELYVSSGSDAGGYLDTTFKFNQSSWATSVSAITAKSASGRGSAQYNSKMYLSGGFNLPGAGAALTQNAVFNKASWLADTVLPAARQEAGIQAAFGFFYVNQGTSTNSATDVTSTGYKYNGTSWATPTAWAQSRAANCSFQVGNAFLSSMAGYNSAGAPQQNHETRTSADVVSTATVVPATNDGSSACNANANLGIVSGGFGGAPSTVVYSWNGTSWSSALTDYNRSAPAMANSPSRQLAYTVGGNAGAALTTNSQYNGFSFQLNPVLLSTKSNGTAASF